MNENDAHEIQKIEQRILDRNPHWSQEKAHWIALQSLGLFTARKK